MRRIIILLLAVLAVTLVIYEDESFTEKITGSATGSSSISFRILSECNIPLKEGWNLISVCSNLSNKSVKSALKDIENDYRYVLRWNRSAQEFDIYSPLAAENDFNVLEEDKSYFVYLEIANSTINAEGKPFGDLEIPLVFGWNTPVYPYTFQAEVIRYLESINDSYRYVMVWNSSSQEFLIFSPLAVENDFSNISEGEGQFVYISNTSGAILKYNKSRLQ